MPITPRQEKLISLLMENYGNKKTTKTLKALLLEAGYTESSAKNPKLILESVAIEGNEELNSFITQLSNKRKLAITHLTEKKMSKAPARELVYVIDILTKNSQLLGGKDTGRDKIIFGWEK